MGFNFKAAARVESKALGPHPAFQDSNTPVSVYSPGATRKDAVISQREAMRHLDAYGGRQAIDWVADCIKLYADPAATAPFALREKDGTRLVEVKSKGTPPDYKVGPQDLYSLLHRPNPFMYYDELMSLLVTDLFLVGNAYWMKWQTPSSGRPLALYRLAPSHVKIVPGSFGPLRYEYQPPGAKEPLKLEPKDIVHFKLPNPHSHYYGMGVIQAAGRAMDLEIAITDTMAAYYENRADPSMIISSERKLSRDTFNKLRAQMRARVAGSSRAGELLVLESGLKATSLSTSASDALFDKLSTMSMTRILTKFRASALLFGMADATSGSNKISDARREFDNYALRPLLKRLERPITEALTAAWGVEFIIDYQTLLPAEDAQKIGAELSKMPGIKVREIRKQYAQFGIEESTGDSEIDETILNMPTPEMDENGQQIDPVTGKVVSSGGLGADRPLAGEAGRPPKGENTRNFRTGSGKKSLDDLMAALDVLEQKSLNSAGERVTVGNRLPDEKRPSDPFASSRKIDIDLAMAAMAMELRGAAGRLEPALIADIAEGKALKTSDIVKRLRSSEAWKTFKVELTAILEKGAAAAAQSGAMHSNRTPEEEVDYADIARSVVNRPEGVRAILATLKERVISRVKEARSENAERGEFEAAVRGALADWSDRQVVAIADSEATEAYNEATLTMFELSGEEQVYVHEEDDAPDEGCQQAAGQVWDIDHARAHRKEHPRCRRAFISLADVPVG